MTSVVEQAERALRKATIRRLADFPSLFTLARRVGVAARYLLRLPHDREYAILTHFPEGSGQFIDVGANAGQSALTVRSLGIKMEIVSIEPQQDLLDDLKFASRLIKRHYIVAVAAGSARGTATMKVPILGRSPLVSSAWIDHTEIARAPELPKGWRTSSVDSVEVEVLPLDELNLIPRYIKIDVEGMEEEVICGLRQTIDRHKPILLVENRSSGVVRRLRDMHYQVYGISSRGDRLRSQSVLSNNLLAVGRRLDQAIASGLDLDGSAPANHED